MSKIWFIDLVVERASFVMNLRRDLPRVINLMDRSSG